MSLTAGTTVKLAVARETPPYGYFLTDGRQEVLLPYAEAEGRFAPGDRLDVFLFHDTKDRLTATMRQPLIRLGEPALLSVADVHPRLGLFLDIGLGRHLLLPKSELPDREEVMPAVGDRVYVVPGHDKQGRLIARLARETDLQASAYPAPTSWKNRWVEARVYKSSSTGAFVFCGDETLGFGAFGLIHDSERLRPLRIGECVRARVAHVREDGRVNLSLRPLKHEALDADAAAILAYLQTRPGGAMPYSDQTPADLIKDKFAMSKAAFKRALGRLMKENRVEQKGNWTYLKTADPSAEERT